MALSITQTPAVVSLAQSPMIFTLSESGMVVTSASFQYYLDLYYWQGSITSPPAISQYTLVKYPNASNVGIFDVSKVINSTLTGSRESTPSNVTYYKVEGYYRYQSGSAFVTSSKEISTSSKALDGYGIFDEAIGAAINTTTPHWPLMTSGPVTQSFFEDNNGTIGVFAGTTGTSQPTKVVFSGSLGNGEIAVSSSISSSQQIQQVPLFPASIGFPISANSEFYTVQAYNGSTPLGTPISYTYKCKQKYPNVRIKWKNRFGQFDYFNFDMVSKRSFSTTAKGYQPQLGTWDGATLAYNDSDSSNLNYIVDSKQSISVNTDWIPEAYNEILKQLLVSEEVYIVDNEVTGRLTPITIATESVTFKTGVVDKTIQYGFEFDLGQGYKLLL
jgi:hypothetical protein